MICPLRSRSITRILGAAFIGACLLSARAVAHSAPAVEPYVWRNVEVQGGGFISGIIFSPARRDLLYARTDIGGAYRWDPTAKRWAPLIDFVSQTESNLLGIESLAPDPSDPNRLYLAVGTYTHAWASIGAILRSNDEGKTFARTDMPFKMGGNEDGRSIGERLAVDPNDGRVLFMGSRNDGLWRSADRGVTWARVSAFPVTGRTNGIGIGFVLFDRRSGKRGAPTQTIYVGSAAGGECLYRSLDAGQTWQPVPGAPQAMLAHHGVITSAGLIYLTVDNGPGPNGVSAGGVWKLDTGNGAWTDITPTQPAHPGFAGLSVDPANPNTLLVSTIDRWNPGDDVFQTSDGGKTWHGLSAQSTRNVDESRWLTWGGDKSRFGWWIGALALDPFRPTHVLYGTGATIFGSDDVTAADAPTHWTARAAGIEETAVMDLISPPEGAHLLSGMGDIGGFLHDDITKSPSHGMMTNPVMGLITSLDFAAQHPLTIVRVGQGSANGAISTDGGITWKPFATTPAGPSVSGAVAISADGASIVWSPDASVPSVTTDSGRSWKSCAGLAGGMRVVSDRVNARRFYALDSTGNRLLSSSDGGATFAHVDAAPAGCRRLRPVPDKEGNLWAPCGGSGLQISTDGGANWAKLAEVQSADAVGFGRAAPGAPYPAVYIAGRVDGVDGIFRSDDKGKVWMRVNDNAHQYGWIGECVTGDPRVYGRVYVATNGRGIPYGEPAKK